MLTITPIADTPINALEAAMPHAPYLTRLFERDGLSSFEDALAGMRAAGEAATLEEAMAAMRAAKRAGHLALAADDLSGECGVMQITAKLTALGDAAIEAAMQVALRLKGLSSDGLFAVALGKMGANELNYSSDIDFVVLYDPDVFDGGERYPGDAAARIVRDMVKLLDERTADGYVFRTDLRLRPDPSSTPLAVSTRMAEGYYESVGQNWERMVWIKARAAAGDKTSAARFLEAMRPFVWRRNLDYWAIADIHAIKHMVNTKIGGGAFGDVSPDVKLGPGGIREIEFFAQTQQLIRGGRDKVLRVADTLGALDALTDNEVIDGEVRTRLQTAYKALRHVEHRIQMVADQQTHRVPEQGDARASVAALCGYTDLAAFDADLLATRRLVHAAYQDLFAEEGRQAEEAETGNLVFTGVDDDPGTVETLAGFGFTDPPKAIAAIRDWHRGRVPATRTPRGRELLTALLPKLLAAMGDTGEPDEAFKWFGKFFEGLPYGVQTLSMLMNAPDLLEDVVATLAIAPRLAETLARRPDLLEVLVRTVAPAPIDAGGDGSFESAMDAERRYNREHVLALGHRLLHGRADMAHIGEQWSDLAEGALVRMAAAARAETEARFGAMPGRVSICALGKLGGREMTAGSDLDLLVIYDAADPLEAQSWFTRYTQRLITALSAQTAEGALYEVDMRLRPSGGAGPVATSLASFGRYQREEAWTWEHMALTRMRPVVDPDGLGYEALLLAQQAILARAENRNIPQDVGDMRARLGREKPGYGLWDMKSDAGGMVDIEFIVQQAELMAGRADILHANTGDAIEALKETGDLKADIAATLASALALFQRIQQVQRIAVGSRFNPETAPTGLKRRLCKATGLPDFEALEAEINAVKTRVRAISADLLQLPATD